MSPAYDDSVAAASATATTNVISGKNYSQKPYFRHFTGIGIVGGNAINEAKLQLKVGGQDAGTYLNTKSGVAAVQKDDVRPLDIGVEANELIELVVIVAPTVSPIVWQLTLDP